MGVGEGEVWVAKVAVLIILKTGAAWPLQEGGWDAVSRVQACPDLLIICVSLGTTWVVQLGTLWNNQA